MAEDEQVELMIDWFSNNYMDPVHRLPYNSREGGYQWVFGGPIEASEALQDEFSSLIELSVIERAVEEIESDGTLEWSPIPDEDFFDDSERNYESRSTFPDVVDADADWPPIVAVPLGVQTGAHDDRSEFVDALSTLQGVLEARPRIVGLGHNRPPSSIEDTPLSENAINLLVANISELRAEAESAKPEPTRIGKGLGLLRNAFGQISAWIGGRVTKAVDAFLVAGAAASGAKIAWSWDLVKHLLEDAIHFGQAWINSFF
jgi:hypothetical protein